MAATHVQREAEAWVRDEWLAREFKQIFSRKDLPLFSGGRYSFDAVSADDKTAAVISTSGARTSSGNYGVGKMLKIRSDMFFLMLANVQTRMVILTERDMYELCVKEKERGRIPEFIELKYAKLPDDLAYRLRSARKIASDEVTPRVGA